MSKHSAKKLAREETKVKPASKDPNKNARIKKLKAYAMLLSVALTLGSLSLPLILMFFSDIGNSLGEPLIVISTVLIAGPLGGMVVVVRLLRKENNKMNNLPDMLSGTSQSNTLACNDYMHKLTELARMYRDGLLTKEEFDQAKKKII